MKNREKKILRQIDTGKQSQFDGIPESIPYEKKEKRYASKKPPTYWICKNEHIFEIKHRVHPSKEHFIRCPECNASIKNAVNKGGYMYYLNKHGRGDKKQYIKRFGEKGNNVKSN